MIIQNTIATTAFVKNVNANIMDDISINLLQISTIQPNTVTNSKLSNMLGLTLKGNNNAISANPLDLSVTQVKTLLGATSTPSIYNIVQWDTVNSLYANKFVTNITSTVTSSNTLTLTSSGFIYPINISRIMFL